MLFLFPWLSPLCWVLVVALIDFALFNISRHGFFLTRSSTKMRRTFQNRFYIVLCIGPLVDCSRAPDGLGWAGLGWAEKNKPMGCFIFYWPSPPWAGPRIGSPAQALASGNQPMG